MVGGGGEERDIFLIITAVAIFLLVLIQEFQKLL